MRAASSLKKVKGKQREQERESARDASVYHRWLISLLHGFLCDTKISVQIISKKFHCGGWCGSGVAVFWFSRLSFPPVIPTGGSVGSRGPPKFGRLFLCHIEKNTEKREQPSVVHGDMTVASLVRYRCHTHSLSLLFHDFCKWRCCTRQFPSFVRS